MQKFLLAITSGLALFAISAAWSHPGTEQYIPIGKSPGISNVKSYVGAIRSVRETESGFSMAVEDADMQIDVDQSTKIYLDTGSGNANTVGSEEDCRVGRTVEVYLHESGVAYWVKIKMP